jgi:modulator of FtsH protease HflC
VLIALLAAAGVALARSVMFVDETEYVYVMQFGEPLRLCVEPGLHFKWPYQSAWRFDRRLQIYEPPAREMLTEDKENLTFAWYVCWRIAGQGLSTSSQAQPPIETYVRRYLQSVGDVATAENRLEERIQAALAAEIGHTRLAQLVSLEPDGVQLAPIFGRVTRAVSAAAAEHFGIEIVDVRLKRFNYPEAVKPAVFAEIRSERERVAVQYRAEGASQKTKIESRATLERDQLLAQAKREAARIRGEGEAKAIEISNAAHRKDPQFYELLKTLETYRAMLDEQTTVVLSADSPLLKLFTRGLPTLPAPSAPPPTEARNQPNKPVAVEARGGPPRTEPAP